MWFVNTWHPERADHTVFPGKLDNTSVATNYDQGNDTHCWLEKVIFAHIDGKGGVLGQMPKVLNQGGTVQKRKRMALFLWFASSLGVIHIPSR